MTPKNRYLASVLVAALTFGGSYALTGHSTDDREVIRITARKFEYSPSHIELRQGVPVTLQLTSEDRLHGFNIPDLDLRADLLPGQTVSVDLIPEKAGRLHFLCDIFCGDGHDEMQGTITVLE